MNIYNWTTKFSAVLIIALLSCLPMDALAENQDELINKIEKVDFLSLAGGRVAIKVQTSQPMANPPAGFTLNNPPRIALDFPGAVNGLSKSNLNAGQGALKSVSLAQSKDRTRMVLNLSRAVAYNTTVSGNETTIVLQESQSNAGATNTVTRFAEAKVAKQHHTLTNVDFERGKNGEGRIMVDLSDATTGIDIKQHGKTVIVEFIDTDLAANLERRLNVVNFSTPVVYIDTMKQGKNTRMVIEPQGNWEQSAYQADKRFIIEIKPVVDDPNKLVQGSKAGYNGEKLSLNFQNVDVRSVLQVIADFTGFNIITSDTVTGNLTLRLKDVPWDQALDIIMQAKGLSQRKTGNVVWIAPTAEIAAKEKLTLEASQQIEDLEPLQTEVFTLRYAKADAVKALVSDAKQKILSKRGSAVVDLRTNTLFVQDTSRRLEDVQRIVNQIDVAVKQVMIESRLVIADERFGRQLGARFGIQHEALSGKTGIGVSGTTPQAQSLAVTGGVLGTPQDLSSNLPVVGPSLAFSLFRLPAGFLLNLELSALEQDNRGKVISSPRVTTADQQEAYIEQGTEIPYQEASSSGATTTSFKEAVLSLKVTPQITPDNKIIMDLEVKKDRVGRVFNGVPSIDTQKVVTKVLVANGETAVLGGIYEQIDRTDIDKVPFFGDLPFVGTFFKRTNKTNDKTELLIFVTPKVLNEELNLH